MKSKQAQICYMIERYCISIKTIFNIISASALSTGVFEICEVEYRQRVDQQRLTNWVCRHAYIDVFELTRELLNYVLTDMFDEELRFSERMKEYKTPEGKCIYKKRKKHEMQLSSILQVLENKDDHSELLQLYDELRKCRNCLSHRFGYIREVDKPPLKLIHYSVEWIALIDHEESRFSTREGAIQCINGSNHENREIRLKPKRKSSLHALGEQLKVGPENVYAVSLKLYTEAKNILISCLNENASLINESFSKNDPFRLKIEGVYIINNTEKDCVNTI